MKHYYTHSNSDSTTFVIVDTGRYSDVTYILYNDGSFIHRKFNYLLPETVTRREVNLLKNNYVLGDEIDKFMIELLEIHQSHALNILVEIGVPTLERSILPMSTVLIMSLEQIKNASI